MSALVSRIAALHGRVFAALERLSDGWLGGLAARFVFLAVLARYFFHSAQTKVGSGFPGAFQVQQNAYFQIVPPVVEAAGYNAGNVAFVPWGLIVWAGTYAEFVLPALIIVGLFTRLAALGMIVFVLVQSYVDIVFHDVGPETAGAWFDRFSDGLIWDQRTLWVFLLGCLVLKGAGALSLDGLLARMARKP